MWGRNKSCDFFNNACNSEHKSDEFAFTGDLACTHDAHGQGGFLTDDFSDGCQYYAQYNGFDCTVDVAATKIDQNLVLPNALGPTSKCFRSTYLNQQYNGGTALRCFQYDCRDNNTSLFVKVADQVLQCHDEETLSPPISQASQ